MIIRHNEEWDRNDKYLWFAGHESVKNLEPKNNQMEQIITLITAIAETHK